MKENKKKVIMFPSDKTRKYFYYKRKYEELEEGYKALNSSCK